MKKKFKTGDRVYHRNLKLYGIFIGYAWESNEEADVDFEMKDGYVEQRRVSINQLDKHLSDKEIVKLIVKYNSGIKEKEVKD